MAAKKWHGSKWIRKDRRLAIHLRDGFQCLYCGKDLRGGLPRSLTLDHLIPRSSDGDNSNENLVTACDSCNSSRQDRPLEQFAPGGALDRIRFQVQQPLNLEMARAILAGETGDPRLERG